jgi:hypothetical protein
MKIWIDKIEFPKLDVTSKDTAGREFRQAEMVVFYTYYKDGNHVFNGEFTCSTENKLNTDELKERIITDLKNDKNLKS